jgi:hypothetical protein
MLGPVLCSSPSTAAFVPLFHPKLLLRVVLFSIPSFFLSFPLPSLPGAPSTAAVSYGGGKPQRAWSLVSYTQYMIRFVRFYSTCLSADNRLAVQLILPLFLLEVSLGFAILTSPPMPAPPR